eukprot:m.30633 g.30633  ORF g.30633 m.30633 type:complete len:50 (-) comp10628_c0_seq1:311-460(-)
MVFLEQSVPIGLSRDMEYTRHDNGATSTQEKTSESQENTHTQVHNALPD